VFGYDAKSPVYGVIADSRVGGNVLVNQLDSCYWGMFRVTVDDSMVNTNMTLSDPDAMTRSGRCSTGTATEIPRCPPGRAAGRSISRRRSRA